MIQFLTIAFSNFYNRYKKVAMIDSVELSKEDIDQLCQAYNAKQQNENQQQPENNSKSNVNLFYKF